MTKIKTKRAASQNRTIASLRRVLKKHRKVTRRGEPPVNVCYVTVEVVDNANSWVWVHMGAEVIVLCREEATRLYGKLKPGRRYCFRVTTQEVKKWTQIASRFGRA